MSLAFLLCMCFGGCDFNPGADRTGCGGFPEAARALPDTTLIAGDPPLEIDLLQAPPFFRHTEGKFLVFSASTSNRDVVYAGVSGVGGRVLVVDPMSFGTAQVFVGADDDCEKEASLSFTVKVTEEEPAP